MGRAALEFTRRRRGWRRELGRGVRRRGVGLREAKLVVVKNVHYGEDKIEGRGRLDVQSESSPHDAARPKMSASAGFLRGASTSAKIFLSSSLSISGLGGVGGRGGGGGWWARSPLRLAAPDRAAEVAPSAAPAGRGRARRSCRRASRPPP